VAIGDIKSGPHEAHIDIQIAAYWELERNGTDEGMTFDDKTHTFTCKGEVIPSVTQILKANRMTPEGYEFIDPWYLQRGTFIHLATEMHDKGTLDDFYDDTNILPYLEAYKTALRDNAWIVTGIEKKLWHPKLKYAGIIDRTIEGHICYALHLKPGRKIPYKLEPVSDIRGKFNIFISALNVFTWRKENLKEVAHE
jgi:hypothetical protein